MPSVWPRSAGAGPLKLCLTAALTVPFVWVATGTSATASGAPLNYLEGYGARAHPVVGLTWGVIIVSLAVIVIISALVIAAVFHRRPTEHVDPARKPPLVSGGGTRWIPIGITISAVVLLVTVVWTMRVLAMVAQPPNKPDLTIEVTAHQWWWEARYLDPDPARAFTTANELHIPVGKSIRLRLIAPDVIHAFWVPALGGQTDMVPGQVNLTWIEASEPGTYRGQCVEYCGIQHANMAMTVVAEPPDQFETWRREQANVLADAAKAQAAGSAVFEAHCSKCHTVRGTAAAGTRAPDLTHLMSRSTLGAGLFQNTRGHLEGWILDPQSLKPGTQMPDTKLSPQDLRDITSFLEA
ncbi:MAG TPA: cytochrome c oxidase subunit II, partial [Stellaceae bacterium]|nr:cytochrome c oxidase subunit II [Stellaceae bacterium]